MNTKFVFVAVVAFALAVEALTADVPTKDEQMEDSTKSPIADFAVIDAEVKATTERPPIVAASAPKNSTTSVKSEQIQNAQPHTVADFIIHPLIAFKPRAPEDSFAGKQAADSSTTPSPWSIFGFNAGQGLGSSVSSLAGSVSGWLNNRIQLPGLVDSPIRDPFSNNTPSTTTTTQRPDVIVRVQHKATTRRPLIQINNRNRPANFQNLNNFASDEYDDEYDEEFVNNNKRRKNQNNRRKPNRPQNVEEEDEDSVEEVVNRPIRRPQQNQAPLQKRRRRPFVEADIFDEADEEDDDDEQEDDADEESDDNNDVEQETLQRPNKRRLVAQSNNKRRRLPQQQQWRPYYAGNQRRRLQNPALSDDDDEDEDNNESVKFYYGSRPSTKRSQNEAGFFQRGQENIIKQIRQLTRGYTPAEIGALVGNNAAAQQGSSKKKQRQQTTLLVNRNGQTIYLAPELLNVDLPLVNTQVLHVSQSSAQAPKPPLSVPLKHKNAPTQYITIPWSQLGISPPDQLHSVTEGVQSQPLILNIPASTLEALQNQSQKNKKKPVITAEAVPLLAEASIVDVFKPPTFPNDRDTAVKPSASSTPVIIATSKKKSSTSAMRSKSSVLPHRIRSGTIVEKAPVSADSQPEALDDMSVAESVRKVEKKFIIVGEDADPGLGRQAQPLNGNGRYAYGAQTSPYVGLLRLGQFPARRNGRDLDTPVVVSEQQGVKQMPNGEKLIPVQIISEPEMIEKAKGTEPASAVSEPQKDMPGVQSETQMEVAQKEKAESSVSAQEAPAA